MSRPILLVVLTAAAASCGQAPRPAVDQPFTKQPIEVSTGVRLAYAELGDSTGEPVIFLHGYTDTGRSFHGTALALNRLRPELRLIVLDQRGHGSASMPDSATCAPAPERCFRPADFAADLIGFMDRARIQRAHLVGHSMGSLVAQEVALTRPERVRRIALIGSAARTAGHPAFTEFLLAGLTEGPWRESLARQGLRFPVDAYLRLPTDADSSAQSWMVANFIVEPLTDPKLVSTIASEAVRIPVGTWLGVARALAAYDNTDRLAALTVPTLVVWGTQDNLFGEPDQARLRQALDRAVASCRTSYTWKQYGREPLGESGQPTIDFAHSPHWAAPEAVAADLAAFLRDGGAPTRDLSYGVGLGPAGVRTEAGKATLIAGAPEGCSPA